jgi:hypothetical protein
MTLMVACPDCGETKIVPDIGPSGHKCDKPCDLEDPYANVHRIGLEREGWDIPPEAA